MSEPKYRVTVFTPCYNAAKTIQRVWESLNQQTFRDFEWLVINDASTDDTASVLDEYKKNAGFPMRVISYDINRGKMCAWNDAIELSEGEFITATDADDRLTDDSLETLINAWDNIPKEQQKDFWAVYGHCRDQYGNFVGTQYPSDPFDGHYYEVFFKHKVKGEKHGVHRTDIIRNHRWPTVGKLVPEGYLLSVIGNRYKIRYINKVTRIYYIDQPMSLASKGLRGELRYIEGRHYYYKNYLNENFKYLHYRPGFILSRLLLYGRYSRHAGRSFCDALDKLEGLKLKLAFAFCYPVSLGIAISDKILKKV